MKQPRLPGRVVQPPALLPRRCPSSCCAVVRHQRQSSADARPRWAQHHCGQWAAGGAGEEAPALAELWDPLSPTLGAAV